MMAIAQLSRFPQHARGKVDPVNAAGRPDCLAQERKIPSAAAAHVKDAVAAPESEALDRAPAQPRRNTEYPVEKRYDVGQTIVALADEITVAIHPLIRHALLPYLFTRRPHDISPGSRGLAFSSRLTPVAPIGIENHASAQARGCCRVLRGHLTISRLRICAT